MGWGGVVSDGTVTGDESGRRQGPDHAGPWGSRQRILGSQGMKEQGRNDKCLWEWQGRGGGQSSQGPPSTLLLPPSEEPELLEGRHRGTS